MRLVHCIFVILCFSYIFHPILKTHLALFILVMVLLPHHLSINQIHKIQITMVSTFWQRIIMLEDSPMQGWEFFHLFLIVLIIFPVFLPSMYFINTVSIEDIKIYIQGTNTKQMPFLYLFAGIGYPHLLHSYSWLLHTVYILVNCFKYTI